MVTSAIPVRAQFERIGGAVEFRSADRPIGVPALRVPESAGLSSDSGKPFGGDPIPPDEVLKRIDIELGRPGPTAIDGTHTGPPPSLYNAGEHLEKQSQASSASK